MFRFLSFSEEAEVSQNKRWPVLVEDHVRKHVLRLVPLREGSGMPKMRKFNQGKSSIRR